ncbi:hypothetical protein HDU90_003694 [Geranomyces variabilis]|nr:hypothetical protein HDU90_003694 [Geranomyces variabilis]
MMLRELEALDAVEDECDLIKDRIRAAKSSRSAARFRNRPETVLFVRGSLNGSLEISRISIPIRSEGPHISLHFGAQIRECEFGPNYFDDDNDVQERVYWMEIPPAELCSAFQRIPDGSTRALLYRSKYGKRYGKYKLKQLITADGGVLPDLARHFLQVSYLGSTNWTAKVLASALGIPSKSVKEEDDLAMCQFTTRNHLILLSREPCKEIYHKHPVYELLKSVRQHYTDLLNIPWQKIANRSAQLSTDHRHCGNASEILALEPVLSKYAVLKGRSDFALRVEEDEGFFASLHIQPRDETVHPIKFDFGGHITRVGGEHGYLDRQFKFQFITGPETYPSGKKYNLLTRAGYAEVAAILEVPETSRPAAMLLALFLIGMGPRLARHAWHCLVTNIGEDHHEDPPGSEMEFLNVVMEGKDFAKRAMEQVGMFGQFRGVI